MLDILRRIIQEVNSAADLDQALGIIVQRVRESVAVDVASVYLKTADTGEFVLPGEEYNPRPLDVTRTRERALNDYSLGGVELEALGRLVTQLDSLDIEVVVVEMPFVAEDYLDMHPDGVADYEAYRQLVATFTDGNDLAYIDLTDYPWTTDEFYDFLHVNSTGIAIVNAMVADALAANAG